MPDEKDWLEQAIGVLEWVLIGCLALLIVLVILTAILFALDKLVKG